MERTLDTVLKSIGNPALASGLLSRSPSPTPQTASTQALIATSSPSASSFTHTLNHIPPSSPKLHSLPDNSLNPLGLLAEASLANRRAQGPHFNDTLPKPGEDTGPPTLGVLSRNYFKPGEQQPCFIHRARLTPARSHEHPPFASTVYRASGAA